MDWSRGKLTPEKKQIYMCGIYANIWGILMVNVTIYSIHGSYGMGKSLVSG